MIFAMKRPLADETTCFKSLDVPALKNCDGCIGDRIATLIAYKSANEVASAESTFRPAEYIWRGAYLQHRADHKTGKDQSGSSSLHVTLRKLSLNERKPNRRDPIPDLHVGLISLWNTALS